MASAVFRLPSKAPYGYVEVTLDETDIQLPSELRVKLLEELLADLNQVLPQGGPNTPVASFQDARSADVPEYVNGAKTTCEHGNRKKVSKSNWTAWFCPLEDKNAQCKAEFEKKNK